MADRTKSEAPVVSFVEALIGGTGRKASTVGLTFELAGGSLPAGGVATAVTVGCRVVADAGSIGNALMLSITGGLKVYVCGGIV